MKYIAISLLVTALLIGGGVLVAKHPQAMQQAAKKEFTPNAPIEWAHGWKTSRVTATRYSNKQMGYNIGFTFPQNPNDCDRAELSDFIESHGGGVYESGGYPGAEMFASFKDVKDRDSANKKLREILPAFNQLMQDITDGKIIPPIGGGK